MRLIEKDRDGMLIPVELGLFTPKVFNMATPLALRSIRPIDA